jgi:hypothetical protein
MTHGMNNLQANVCLLAVTLCWSCEVIIFSVIPDGVNPKVADSVGHKTEC